MVDNHSCQHERVSQEYIDAEKEKENFGTSDIDAKKMMQRSKVSHGKIRVNRRNNLVKKG
jgi:hypothetical protein